MRGLEVDLVTNEKHIKKHNESIENIQEELKVVLENLQLDVLEKKNAQLIERINHVEEVFSKINEKTLLTEDNPTLPGDPSTNNSDDPLTPLDQKYVTLEQLQQHYRLFVQRVQTQLATIGGGGETRLRYLDDIVGIATNLSAYDGMYLGIDASNSAQPFVFSSVSGGGGGGTGAGGTWSNYDSNTGVTTTKKVKIQNNLEVTGVTTSTGGFVGNLTGTATGLSGTPDITIRNITGVAATFTGVLTYEDVTNIDSVGLITARSGIKVLDEGINVVGVSTIRTGVGTVHVGVGSTTLLVDGDARVTGILTIGSGSITLDPTAKKIEGIDEIIIGTGTTVRIHQDTSGEIAFSDRDGKQASVGIGTTVSINTTGIITATTFDGSLATSNLSGTITNDQLAGSIGNAKLANSSIAIGGVTLNLGDTDATPAFDLSDATSYPFTSLTGITTVISGDTTPTLGGNLNLNSKTINGTGNVNITGIITASSFSGDGSGLTGVASTDNIITGTAATFNNVVKVGTGITLDATSGIVTATGVNVIGIVTATSFVGDGSQLSNIISGVGIQSASTRIWNWIYRY